MLYELGLDAEPIPDSKNSLTFTRWIETQILARLDAPVVLAFDEVDSTFDYDYRRDFFRMLRSWHNRRASRATWRRLGLALVISTERSLLIDNPTSAESRDFLCNRVE